MPPLDVVPDALKRFIDDAPHQRKSDLLAGSQLALTGHCPLSFFSQLCLYPDQPRLDALEQAQLGTFSSPVCQKRPGKELVRFGGCGVFLGIRVIRVAAMMSGESDPTGISAWVSTHKEKLIEWLRPACGRAPSLSTVRRVFYAISVEALEGAVGAYLQGLRGEMGESGQTVTQSGERLQGLAVDGKTVRCATAHGTVTHLVSVVGHEDGIVLSQANAEAKLNETTVARKLLAALPLEGTILTFDALHTSVKMARQIRQAGGHYLFVVKRNQNRNASTKTSMTPSAHCRRRVRAKKTFGSMSAARSPTAAMDAPLAWRWRAPRRSTISSLSRMWLRSFDALAACAIIAPAPIPIKSSTW